VEAKSALEVRGELREEIQLVRGPGPLAAPPVEGDGGGTGVVPEQVYASDVVVVVGLHELGVELAAEAFQLGSGRRQEVIGPGRAEGHGLRTQSVEGVEPPVILVVRPPRVRGDAVDDGEVGSRVLQVAIDKRRRTRPRQLRQSFQDIRPAFPVLARLADVSREIEHGLL
jgi:hypothetical protein